MLDRLPVELLQHVLRLAYPPRYDWRVYEERRRDLRSLSLVSRRVKGVAQPMLPEVYAVEAGTAVHPRRNDQPRMSDIHSLLVEMPSDSLMSPVFEVDAWTRLSELWIEECRVDWKELANCQELCRLELKCCSTVSAARPPIFPRLVYFSAQGVTFDTANIGNFLSPSVFPSLKLLCVSELSESKDFDELFVLDPAAWGTQLTVLCMDWDDVKELHPQDLRLPFLLIDHFIESDDHIPLSPLPAHLQLTISDEYNREEGFHPIVASTLHHLAQQLMSEHHLETKSSLKVLVLPRSCQTCTEDKVTEAACQALLQQCSKCQITVLWDCEEDVSFIPQSFIDYRRRKIREEADEMANKGASEANEVE